MTAKFALAFILLGVVGLWQCAQPPTTVISPQEGKAKKLIYYGWGSPDTLYVRDHWREMEEMPFDGVGIVVPVDRRAWEQGKRDTGNQLGWKIMGKKPFRVENFRAATEDLKAAKWRRFTDNFLPVYLSAAQSTIGLNWFDDARWRIVANNFGVLARIAAEAGVKGLLFDPEDYKYALFNYPAQQRQLDRPFEAYRGMARRRGAEVMAAIAAVMPRPVILSLYSYSTPLGHTQRGTPLQKSTYGLLPAFYDGLLEAMPAGGRLVDGFEHAYAYKERKQFVEGHKRIEAARALSAVPDRYREKVEAGFGLWIDYKKNPNYFTPQEFQRAVTSALEISDGYVWIYSEHVGFFPPSRVEPPHLKAIAAAREANR